MDSYSKVQFDACIHAAKTLIKKAELSFQAGSVDWGCVERLSRHIQETARKCVIRQAIDSCWRD